jgi:tripartite-type tricarboxylate transporter receptor subunit TctC
MRTLVWRFAIAMLCTLYGCPSTVATTRAEGFPSRPVKIIVQAAVGNGPDALARIIADRLAALWGQRVLIINRPGGGGIIAAAAAASAEPDGYTLYMPSASTFLVLPSSHANLPFNLERDFAPIGLIGQSPMMIAVAPSLGIKSLPELIARAKQSPGKILYAALGRGTLPHLTSELFQRRAGVSLTYIPYSGTPQVLLDIMGGRIAVVFDGVGALSGALESGDVKALAVTSPRRLAHMPDVPTVSETLPDFAALGWYPLLAPAATPDDIVQKVSTDLRAVLGEPGLQEKLGLFGTTVRPMSPAEVSDFIRSEQEKWKPLLNEVGVNPR